MSNTMRKFLSGLLNGLIGCSGAILTALQAESSMTAAMIATACLTGFATAAKDWKSALDEKKKPETF